MKSLKNNAGQSSSSSKILEKLTGNLTANLFLFVMNRLQAPVTRRQRLPNQNKQICCQFCCQFFKNFRWRRALSSIVFQWFYVAKCYSELKNEELSLKQLLLKIFGKFSYYICHHHIIMLWKYNILYVHILFTFIINTNEYYIHMQ